MQHLRKTRGRGAVIVNQISDEEICPEEHRDEGSLFKPERGFLLFIRGVTGLSTRCTTTEKEQQTVKLLGTLLYELSRRTQILLVAGFPRCMVFPLERSVIVSSYSRRSTSTVVAGRSRNPSRNSRNCASFSYTQRISPASLARKSESNTAPSFRSCAMPPRIGTPCGQLFLSPKRFSSSASTSGEIA